MGSMLPYIAYMDPMGKWYNGSQVHHGQFKNTWNSPNKNTWWLHCRTLRWTPDGGFLQSFRSVRKLVPGSVSSNTSPWMEWEYLDIPSNRLLTYVFRIWLFVNIEHNIPIRWRIQIYRMLWGWFKSREGIKILGQSSQKVTLFLFFLAALIALLRFKKREGHDVYDLYVDFDFDVPLPTWFWFADPSRLSPSSPSE